MRMLIIAPIELLVSISSPIRQSRRYANDRFKIIYILATVLWTSPVCCSRRCWLVEVVSEEGDLDEAATGIDEVVEVDDGGEADDGEGDCAAAELKKRNL
jgi:hypothetical protein